MGCYPTRGFYEFNPGAAARNGGERNLARRGKVGVRQGTQRLPALNDGQLDVGKKPNGKCQIIPVFAEV
jgi:hypothetical protein